MKKTFVLSCCRKWSCVCRPVLKYIVVENRFGTLNIVAGAHSPQPGCLYSCACVQITFDLEQVKRFGYFEVVIEVTLD